MTMRIAIAGSGGLARILANAVNETAHPFIILSRSPQPELEALDYQISVVNYDSQPELRFALRGVDLIISTVSGTPQINLIDAAANSSVRRFVPAEFEGPPNRRPRPDPLDRGRAACIERLRFWSRHERHRMPFTIFTCGVFYERFNRGGLGSLGIGAGGNCFYAGSYLMDVAAGTAQVVEHRADGTPVHVAMTSVYDLARFLVAAVEQLDLDTWLPEFRLLGDRRTVTEIVQWAESVRGTTFESESIVPTNLQRHIDYATYCQDCAQVTRIHELVATEQRRYDFTEPNLNQRVNIVPVTFWEWLSMHWAAP